MKEKEEKRALGVRELVEIVGLMVAILVAGTSLLSSSENVPWWWFHFSFIVLIALTFSIPSVILAKPISKRVKKFRKERKQNTIAQRHFAEFKDLVRNGRRFTLGIFSVLDRLKGQFENIKEKTGMLPIHLIEYYNRSDVESLWETLKYRLDAFDEITLRELTLSTEQFDMILRLCKKNIALVTVFAREIEKEHTIPDHIEKEYEAFREKYNDFMKDCNKYFHKLNQELGKRIISEHFDYAKKW